MKRGNITEKRKIVKTKTDNKVLRVLKVLKVPKDPEHPKFPGPYSLPVDIKKLPIILKCSFLIGSKCEV